MEDTLFFEVDAEVRYWEDAIVNGVQEKEDGPVTIPGYVPPAQKPKRFLGGRWVFRIGVRSGRIEGWPSGVTAQTHYKVCDDGLYSYQHKDGTVLHSWNGYVPSVLAPGGEGYGDYIILNIDRDGTIEGWTEALSRELAARRECVDLRWARAMAAIEAECARP